MILTEIKLGEINGDGMHRLTPWSTLENAQCICFPKVAFAMYFELRESLMLCSPLVRYTLSASVKRQY